jgi:hypothetical protein
LADPRNIDDTVERMRSPGAVYTLVRTSSIGATRPSKEMQSGNVAIRIALVKQYPYQRQHLHQRTPESSRQEHQARGIDGKSPKELLGCGNELLAIQSCFENRKVISCNGIHLSIELAGKWRVNHQFNLEPRAVAGYCNVLTQNRNTSEFARLVKPVSLLRATGM